MPPYHPILPLSPPIFAAIAPILPQIFCRPSLLLPGWSTHSALPCMPLFLLSTNVKVRSAIWWTCRGASDPIVGCTWN